MVALTLKNANFKKEIAHLKETNAKQKEKIIDLKVSKAARKNKIALAREKTVLFK